MIILLSYQQYAIICHPAPKSVSGASSSLQQSLPMSMTSVVGRDSADSDTGDQTRPVLRNCPVTGVIGSETEML